MMWDDHDMIDGIVKDNFPRYFDSYIKLRHIMRIDIAKVVILYVHGGLYKDMDFYCRTNFYDDITSDVCLAGSIHPGETVQNGLIAVSPRNRFIKQHLNDILYRISTTEDDDTERYVQENSGPWALTRAHRLLSDSMDIQVLDPDIYNPSVDIFYDESAMSRVKCIHLLSGVWGEDDFQPKHQARTHWEGWRKIKLGDV